MTSPQESAAPGTAAIRPPPALWKILVAFATIYIVWGSTYLTIKWAVEGFPPFLMAGTRFLLAGCALYAFQRWLGAERPTRLHWREAWIVGGLLLLGGNGCVAWASPRLGSGMASLFIATTPLWIVGFDTLRGGRAPGARGILGLLLGCAGLGILAAPRQLSLGNDGGVDPLAVAALVVGPISWAAGSVYARTARFPPSAFMTVALQQITGGALLSIAAMADSEWSQLNLAAVPTRSWLSFFYLVTVGSLVAFTAYIWLVQNVAASKVATYAYVNPVVALFLGWLLNNEPLGANTILAAAVILAAVLLISLDRLRSAPGPTRAEAPAENAPRRDDNPA